MRIALYHPRAHVGDGGITNSVRHLSRALARRGESPVVVVDDGEPRLPTVDGVEWRGVRHVGSGSLRRPRDLGEAVADADVLVLHSAWAMHNVVAGRVARRLGLPYVLAARGAYDPLIRQRRRWAKGPWWLALERPLFRGAAAQHVFFDSQRAHLTAMGWQGPWVVAPNGVEVPDGPGWDGGSAGRLLYLGRFDPEHKGLDLLVRARAGLGVDEVPPLHLHGPDWRGGKQVVVDLVDRLGAADRIHVGEPLYGEDKWTAFRTAVGFAYPSRWEGFGNSVAEAAALGVPTLVTPYPLGEHLAERGAAVLAEPTVEGLADGLRALAGPDAARMGERAREVVRGSLTWDAVAERWAAQLAPLC